MELEAFEAGLELVELLFEATVASTEAKLNNAIAIYKYFFIRRHDTSPQTKNKMKILILLTLFITCNLQAQTLPTIKQLSSLCNPEKLATLKKGNRSGNNRFKKIMYWIHAYEEQGTKPKEFLIELYSSYITKPYQNSNHVFAPKTEKLNLEAQYRLGKVYGLYTKENLPLLKKGNAAFVTKGEYKGEKIEIDHLIPYSKAPSLENSMANLTWLPRTVNRTKGAKITNGAKRRAKALNKEVGCKIPQYLIIDDKK